MINTHKIEIDLSEHNSIQPPVDMVQGDQHSRSIEITLTSDGVAWEPPADATVQVGYTLPGGSQGRYSTTNGNAAGSISGNKVTVIIAPQVLSKAGKVDLAVTLISGDTEISTFPVAVAVSPRPGYNAGQDTGGETGGGSQDGSCNITEEYINELIDAKLAEFKPTVSTYTVEVEVE